MSKWINKDLFDEFQKEKIDEKDKPTVGGINRSDLLWPTPEKGTVENAKIYEGRFLPDPKGEFYMRYYYHFWKSGDNWIFVLCPKTPKSKQTASIDFKNYCPFCSAVSKLYNGTTQDKKQGYHIKRKERFVGNWFVAKDPRDDDRDDEKKVIGKVKLYEFPSTVEKKLKKEITDRDQGYGIEIFDPSENGRNFIINVLSTKPDKNNKQWPDYSNSSFSRLQYPLASTEKEIGDLMNTCVDLVGYIESMKVDKDKQVEILKNEFLWDLVEQECIDRGYVDIESGGNAPVEEEHTQDTPREEPVQEEREEKPEEVSSDDIDDDDLLAELDQM